jgi:hypothetical protein
MNTFMASYCFAFAWGLLVLASLVGWGAVLNRLLFAEHTDWGQRAAWGLALSVVAGGFLNLLGGISRITVLVYLGLGAAAWVIDTLVHGRWGFSSPLLREARRKPLWVGGALIVVLLALVQYGGTVSVTRHDYPSSPAGPVRFNQADDFQAYFVFPEKMLELGSIGRDPFCARGVESSLGGQSFLDTFVLSTLSVQHLHLLDPGLGLLLVIGLLWGSFKERRISPQWTVALLLCFVLIEPPTVNISSLYTGTALFLALASTLGWKAFEPSRFLSRTVIIAILVAAICALKSTFIPACGALSACSFACLAMGQESKRSALAETAATGALSVAFTLPWMISMYQSSGTLLYPLLGRGYHDAFHWLTVSRAIRLLAKHLADATPAALLALAAFYLATRRRGIEGREPVLSLLVGAGVGHVVVTLATGEPNNSRYSFPFLLAAIGMLVAELASRSEEPGNRRREASGPLVVSAAALFLVGSNWYGARVLYSECLHGIREGLRNVPLVASQEVAAYQSLQGSVPPGEPILTRLEQPFLLDFKRNTIFLVDYAVASPPPGMPLNQGSEPLARYLNFHGIRYVAYSYVNEEARHAVIYHDFYSPFTLYQIERTYDFEDRLEELARTRRRIYDDGRNFVLDIGGTL